MASQQRTSEYFKPKPKRTSIGCGNKSRPNNKHKRRSWKKYNKQGH